MLAGGDAEASLNITTLENPVEEVRGENRFSGRWIIYSLQLSVIPIIEKVNGLDRYAELYLLSCYVLLLVRCPGAEAHVRHGWHPPLHHAPKGLPSVCSSR